MQIHAANGGKYFSNPESRTFLLQLIKKEKKTFFELWDWKYPFLLIFHIFSMPHAVCYFFPSCI